MHLIQCNMWEYRIREMHLIHYNVRESRLMEMHLKYCNVWESRIREMHFRHCNVRESRLREVHLIHRNVYTAEVVNGGLLGWQLIACWLGNTYRMGLIPVFGSCLPRKQKLGGLLVLQAVGWRLDTFSVAHRKPRTSV